MEEKMRKGPSFCLSRNQLNQIALVPFIFPLQTSFFILLNMQ